MTDKAKCCENTETSVISNGKLYECLPLAVKYWYVSIYKYLDVWYKPLVYILDRKEIEKDWKWWVAGLAMSEGDFRVLLEAVLSSVGGSLQLD